MATRIFEIVERGDRSPGVDGGTEAPGPIFGDRGADPVPTSLATHRRMRRTRRRVRLDDRKVPRLLHHPVAFHEGEEGG